MSEINKDEEIIKVEDGSKAKQKAMTLETPLPKYDKCIITCNCVKGKGTIKVESISRKEIKISEKHAEADNALIDYALKGHQDMWIKSGTAQVGSEIKIGQVSE